MVYCDDAKILSGITDGDKMEELPNATWISLAPEKADVPMPPAAEVGDSGIKKILRTAAKVWIVAVAGVGLLALGALVIMAASASPDFEPPEEAISILPLPRIVSSEKMGRQLVPQGVTGSGNGTGNFIVEKCRQFLLMLRNIAVFLAEKLEHILPPGARSETHHHWFVAVFLVLLAAVILLITVPVLLCCLKCLIHLIKGVVTSIFPCFSSGERMMRAPGRPGVWIPRDVFQSDPGEYFRLLHAEV
ncbi:uncharacterized protein [Aristolochia californica]|uniref:uncharacterized protein n=1 Tax=Aristolochia californica TaxID=171875 RepID=UPI0035DA8ABB